MVVFVLMLVTTSKWVLQLQPTLISEAEKKQRISCPSLIRHALTFNWAKLCHVATLIFLGSGKLHATLNWAHCYRNKIGVNKEGKRIDRHWRNSPQSL